MSRRHIKDTDAHNPTSESTSKIPMHMNNPTSEHISASKQIAKVEMENSNWFEILKNKTRGDASAGVATG